MNQGRICRTAVFYKNHVSLRHLLASILTPASFTNLHYLLQAAITG